MKSGVIFNFLGTTTRINIGYIKDPEVMRRIVLLRESFDIYNPETNNNECVDTKDYTDIIDHTYGMDIEKINIKKVYIEKDEIISETKKEIINFNPDNYMYLNGIGKNKERKIESNAEYNEYTYVFDLIEDNEKIKDKVKENEEFKDGLEDLLSYSNYIGSCEINKNTMNTYIIEGIEELDIKKLFFIKYNYADFIIFEAQEELDIEYDYKENARKMMSNDVYYDVNYEEIIEIIKKEIKIYDETDKKSIIKTYINNISEELRKEILNKIEKYKVKTIEKIDFNELESIEKNGFYSVHDVSHVSFYKERLKKQIEKDKIKREKENKKEERAEKKRKKIEEENKIYDKK